VNDDPAAVLASYLVGPQTHRVLIPELEDASLENVPPYFGDLELVLQLMPFIG
jgi:hypothetical protein